MDFWFLFFYLLKISFLPCHMLKFSSKTPPSTLGQVKYPIPASSTHFLIFILFILSSKQFLSFILDLGDLHRNHQIPYEFRFQTNSSDYSLAPSTQIHQDPLVHSSNFLNFACCKFGPDLPFLVKFIIFLLQKF